MGRSRRKRVYKPHTPERPQCTPLTFLPHVHREGPGAGTGCFTKPGPRPSDIGLGEAAVGARITRPGSLQPQAVGSGCHLLHGNVPALIARA